VECAADFSYHITSIFTKETDGVLHDTTTLDATIDVFNSHSSTGNLLVFRFLLGGEFATTWFLVWHRDLDPFKRKPDKAQVLQ